MHVIIAIIGVFGAVATIISLSTVAMNGGVKVAIVALVVLLAVFLSRMILPIKAETT